MASMNKSIDIDTRTGSGFEDRMTADDFQFYVFRVFYWNSVFNGHLKHDPKWIEVKFVQRAPGLTIY